MTCGATVNNVTKGKRAVVMNNKGLASLFWGIVAALFLAVPGFAGSWTPDRVAAQVLPLNVIPFNKFREVTCQPASQRVELFKCAATVRVLGSNELKQVTVWARARDERSVCAGLRKPVSAACLKQDGDRDLEAHPEDAYRRWLGGPGNLDQGGTECVEAGSGFAWCQDEPVGDEVFPVKRHTVTLFADGRVVVRKR